MTHEVMEEIALDGAALDPLLRKLSTVGEKCLDPSGHVRDVTQIHAEPWDVGGECGDSEGLSRQSSQKHSASEVRTPLLDEDLSRRRSSCLRSVGWSRHRICPTRLSRTGA